MSESWHGAADRIEWNFALSLARSGLATRVGQRGRRHALADLCDTLCPTVPHRGTPTKEIKPC